MVKAVNGVEIKNLDDLAKAAATPVEGFHKIEFEDDPGFIFLDAEATEKGKAQLQQDYNIPALQNLN